MHTVILPDMVRKVGELQAFFFIAAFNMAEKSETFVTTRYIAYYTTHDLFFSFLSLSRSFRVLIYSIDRKSVV